MGLGLLMGVHAADRATGCAVARLMDGSGPHLPGRRAGCGPWQGLGIQSRKWQHTGQQGDNTARMLETDNRQKSQVGGVAPDAAMAPIRPGLDELEVSAGVLENWQATVDLLAKIANVPAALIMRVHPEEIEVLVASHGPGNVYHPGERASLNTGLYCEMVMSTRHELQVPNALKDPLWNRNPDIALGMISYCGLPLAWPNGEIFGTICILDREEHQHDLPTRQILERFADSITLSLALIFESTATVKEARAATAHREQELRTFLDAIPIPVFRKDAESRWQLGNRALFETVGKTAEECLGRSDLEIYGDPAVGKAVMGNDRRIMASGAAEVIEEEIQTPTGLRTFHSTKVPYRDAEGKIIGVIGAALDITDRKRAEEALRVSEERLRSVLDGSNDGFWERDLVTGKVMHSARMNEILGLPAVDTYPGYHDWIGRMHPGDREKFQPIYDRVLSGKEERIDLVFRTRHADGSWMWIRARAKVSARNEEGKPTRFSGTITDVHQAMVAQEALRESEARFRALTDSAPVGIFQTDASGNNVFLNPAGLTMTGLTPEEARGAGWSSAIHPDDRARVFQEWTDAAAGGRDFSSEYRFLARDGAVTWVRCYGSGIRDPDGRSSGYVGVFVDLTAQRTMQEQLHIASRLAAMGTLVAGVAHEINNPLAGTMAGQGATIEDLRALRERATRREAIDPDALVRELDEDLGSLIDAQVGAQRIACIVKDLVMFGRPDPQRTRVRLVDVVEQGMRWLPGSHVSSATIQVVSEDAPDVIASAGQLGQVIVNLVSNAAKSIPLDRRGVVTIRVGRGSQGTACVEVTDNGSGIRPEVLPRTFDPFFSTREVGQGMGLGLPICHAIVTAHGGTLTVMSEVGKGSTFRVELPGAPVEA